MEAHLNWKCGVFIAMLSCATETGLSKSEATLDVRQQVESKPIGSITEMNVNTIGELNARSEHFGRVFRGLDGDCFVRPPMKEIPPPGSVGRKQRVECPPSMRYEAFQKCGFGVVNRKGDSTCVCQPWGGDPPPDNFSVACPQTGPE